MTEHDDLPEPTVVQHGDHTKYGRCPVPECQERDRKWLRGKQAELRAWQSSWRPRTPRGPIRRS